MKEPTIGRDDNVIGETPAGMPAGGPPPGEAAGGPPPGMPAGGPPEGMPAGGPPPVDMVTGALNMPAFDAQYAEVMSGDVHDNCAMWYIDIRNFRSVNPKFGFLKGNVVLRTLVEGCRKFICKELPIARLGADRFIMLSEGLDYEMAVKAFYKLIDYINDSIAKQGIGHRIGLVGGIYYMRDEDYARPKVKKSLDYASIAHRKAHLETYSVLVLFTDEDLERDMRRITIEQSIDTALETGQIEVWYQPQVDYIYGEVIGAEALARWNHPDLGWISPAEFVPVLENCGKVHDLDMFIWEEACRNAGRWRNVADGNPVPISVNVSRAEMFEEGLLEHFLELQRKYNLPEGSLHLEVTESAFVEEADRLYGVIERIRAHKMMVEMDDFGSGLSSLNMLKDVPVDVVKLDMGFMRTAVNEERGGVVLGSVIRMLQGLDTPIIAEGVETLEQAELLKNMGCHLMQGFHFSRPMPLSDFESFVESSNSIERTNRRERTDSRLEDLMSFDPASSYLFNYAIGGTMLFFANGVSSESIIVNDEFYEQCGLKRSEFGERKVDPIQEIDEASRLTMWRAAAEAREFGSAMCRAQVKPTGRWIECVIRFISPSPRGDIFSLSICRSFEGGDRNDLLHQATQDAGWSIDMLDKVIPNGFVKCSLSTELTIDYATPKVLQTIGLSAEEFLRTYHKSFVEIIVPEDRPAFFNALHASMEDGSAFELDLRLRKGYDGESSNHVFGCVSDDVKGNQWLYMLLLLREDASGSGDGQRSDRTIPFDYFLDEDRLVIHVRNGDFEQEIVQEGWLAHIDDHPDLIAPASAAKAHATIRDVRHHPVSGFSDLKCDLRGRGELRWYHINFVCDADENGVTKVLHGFAQDANDQMGSAKWWRRQAEIDQLTSLLNRNAVEQEINLSMHTNGAGMMFMIDLDGFKRVNDELGHLTGDELLREVSARLSDHFRETDVLGRYGGDEFVAFVPLVNGDAQTIAARRSDDIIRAITAVPVPDGTHAGCSIGVAVCKNRNATFYDLLEVADQAMYESKVAGKGRYTIREMS